MALCMTACGSVRFYDDGNSMVLMTRDLAGTEELELYLASQVSVGDGSLRLRTQRQPTRGPTHVYNYVRNDMFILSHALCSFLFLLLLF
jgi:hypothetical protein